MDFFQVQSIICFLKVCLLNFVKLHQILLGDRASFDQFVIWIEKYHEDIGIARWLLSPNSNLSLISHLDTPTFYQTLAGVTHRK